MNGTPSHEVLQEMLPAAALEILETEHLQHLLAHLRDCVDCTRRLDEYREIAAVLALQLPQQAMDPDRAVALRARLLSRATRGAPAAPLHPRTGVARGSTRAAWMADRWTGWMVAAGLAGVLLMHHAFHRPLSYGWLAAGVLTVILVALGMYARIQRGRVSALRDRLDALERTTTRPAEGVGP